MSKAMSDSPDDDDDDDDDDVKAVALQVDYISTTTSSGKRKLMILLGFFIAAIVLVQSVVISWKPVSIPPESRDEEEDHPTSSAGKRHRHPLMMQQKETKEYYVRELKSSKEAHSRTRKFTKASSQKSTKARYLGAEKCTKAAAGGGKKSKNTSGDEHGCMSLTEDTVDALEEAILQSSNAQEINLCSTTIIFDREISMEQPNATTSIRLGCAGECIFDGNNATRLFRFGKATFPDLSPIDFDLVFKGFTFRNGYGGQGAGGLESGGAIQMIGYAGSSSSRARFENCTFLRNQAPNANGGAIFIETLNIEPPPEDCSSSAETTTTSILEFIDCTFLENYAYNGGGISAVDVSISLERTLFQDNTCVGNFEGGAIFLGSNDFPYPDNVIVTCIGEENVFVGNTDTDIVGPWEGCGLTGARD